MADKRGRYGRLKLSHELHRRGVAANIIDEVLAATQESEAARLKEVWARKFGIFPKDAREYARQSRFLLGRGFAAEAVRRLLGAGQE